MPVNTRKRSSEAAANYASLASGASSISSDRAAVATKRSTSMANDRHGNNVQDETARAPKRQRTNIAPTSSSASLLDSAAAAAAAFKPVTNPFFVSQHRVNGLHPRAEVFYAEKFVEPALAETWKTRLLAEMDWYRPTLKVYGRPVIQSRQIAAYATTSDLKLMYSGHPVEMHHPFPPLLTDIAAHLAPFLGPEVHFNHVMLNLYEDGSRYIGRHRDNAENLCIASVSLGAGRRWIMQRAEERRRRRTGTGWGKVKAGWEDEGEEALPDRKEWTLAPGSLLVMQGDTQALYTHEIPKEPKVKDLRISLTFRQLINKK